MSIERWPEMLRVKDLAKFLGTSQATLYTMRMREDFPKARRPMGKVPMYVTEEIRIWMKELKG